MFGTAGEITFLYKWVDVNSVAFSFFIKAEVPLCDSEK